MRVGLVGNMNNILFSVTRHLRDQGVDAHLVVLGDDPAHFHPANDTFDLDYQTFTRTVPWGAPERFATFTRKEIRERISDFDVLVGCGSAPAYLKRAGRALDILIPYGSDLIEYPFRPTRINRHSLRSMIEFPIAQRRALLETKHVVADLSETVDPYLARLGYRGDRVFASTPQVHTPTYSKARMAEYLGRSHWAHEVKKVREQADVLVMLHARHSWTTRTAFNWTKGTDILLKGLAEAKRRLAPKRIKLVTFEYGPDVLASRALIEELGMTDDVLWLPLCPRKEIMVLLSMADFGCGEFVTSFFCFGALYEVLASGKPVLHHRDDRLYEREYPEQYPMCEVSRAEHVVEHLEGFLTSPSAYVAIGEGGRDWHERYGVQKPVRRLLELLGR